MKFLFQLIVLSILLISFNINGQKKYQMLEDISLDASFGYAPALFQHSNEYQGFSNVSFGLRYEIDELFGSRVFYRNMLFDGNSNNIVVSHQFAGEFTYKINLYSLNNYEKFHLLIHTGIGVGFNHSVGDARHPSDFVGVAQVGLMPELKLSEKVLMYIDVTYGSFLAQNHTFQAQNIIQKRKSLWLFPSIGVVISPF